MADSILSQAFGQVTAPDLGPQQAFQSAFQTSGTLMNQLSQQNLENSHYQQQLALEQRKYQLDAQGKVIDAVKAMGDPNVSQSTRGMMADGIQPLAQIAGIPLSQDWMKLQKNSPEFQQANASLASTMEAMNTLKMSGMDPNDPTYIAANEKASAALKMMPTVGPLDVQQYAKITNDAYTSVLAAQGRGMTGQLKLPTDASIDQYKQTSEMDSKGSAFETKPNMTRTPLINTDTGKPFLDVKTGAPISMSGFANTVQRKQAEKLTMTPLDAQMAQAYKSQFGQMQVVENQYQVQKKSIQDALASVDNKALQDLPKDAQNKLTAAQSLYAKDGGVTPKNAATLSKLTAGIGNSVATAQEANKENLENQNKATEITSSFRPTIEKATNVRSSVESVNQAMGRIFKPGATMDDIQAAIPQLASSLGDKVSDPSVAKLVNETIPQRVNGFFQSLTGTSRGAPLTQDQLDRAKSSVMSAGQTALQEQALNLNSTRETLKAYNQANPSLSSKLSGNINEIDAQISSMFPGKSPLGSKDMAQFYQDYKATKASMGREGALNSVREQMINHGINPLPMDKYINGREQQESKKKVSP